MLTPADVCVVVLSLDAGVTVVERPDGGYRLTKGRHAAGVAPECNERALIAYLSDAVVALQMFERNDRAPDDLGLGRWLAEQRRTETF